MHGEIKIECFYLDSVSQKDLLVVSVPKKIRTHPHNSCVLTNAELACRFLIKYEVIEESYRGILVNKGIRFLQALNCV
jgi:hypothetical protein